MYVCSEPLEKQSSCARTGVGKHNGVKSEVKWRRSKEEKKERKRKLPSLSGESSAAQHDGDAKIKF